MKSSKSNDSASSRLRLQRRRRGGGACALIRVAFVAAVAVATLAAPRAALARKRIVVLEFHGPHAGRLRRQVVHILHRHAALVSAGAYHRAARRLHARRPTSHNVARIARRLSVSGIVVGLVRRHHHRYRLIIVLRAGSNGRIARRLTLRLRHPTLTRHARRRVADVLDRGISFLPPISGESADSDDTSADSDDDTGNAGADNTGSDDTTSSDTGGDNGNGDVPPGLNGKNGHSGGSGDSGSSSHASGASASVSAKASSHVGVRSLPVALSAGVDFVNRNLSFTSTPGLMNKPQNYEGGTVPALLVSAEVYPLAFGKPSKAWTHNVGVTAVVDKVLKIESHVQGMTQALPTSQTRWGVGLVYRWNFGSSPSSPTLKLGVGYNSLSFTIDKSQSSVMIDIPNVSYAYFDPGATIRYPLTAKFAIIGDARFLAITATGEVQEASQYGAAKMTGFHFAVGAAYRLKPRLLLQAGGRWTGISYNFNGNGKLTVDRDGNPATQDVLGASDRYLAGYLTVGYVF